MKLSIDWTDALAGLLFVAFGLLFGMQALGLEIGTAFRMGRAISRWSCRAS